MAELFSIETEAVRLVWGRRRDRPVPVSPETPPERAFGVSVEALRPGVAPQVTIHREGEGYLFEQTDYTLFVRARRDEPVDIRHRDPVMLRGLHASDAGRVVHGILNAGAQVGESRFVVTAGGVPQFAVAVEFVPSKLDYRADYVALRDDVERLARGLALAVLRPTTQPGGSEVAAYPSTLEWLALLRHHLGDLEQALHYVDRHPYRATAPRQAHVRADRIRRPDAAVRRAVLRDGGRGPHLALPDQVPLREYLPAAATHYTLDTPEHRWLAAHLTRMQQRLAEVLEDEASRRQGVRRRQVIREVEAMQHRLADLSHLSVLRAADGELPHAPSLRLRTAPGYREAYRACLRLQRGLFLDGEPLRLALKDLHRLYEYWCYLTLVRLIAERVGSTTEVRALVAVEAQGVRLRLRQGRRQRVRFAVNGGHVVATYNPRFGGRDYLVPQQPDMLLTVQPIGSAASHYVLDAKYRLDASPGYRRRYGMPGPPSDALNDLHRYRDAIRVRGHGVTQALALFPWHDEDDAYPDSRHARMLPRRGVGAIPLLPGATGTLESWLDDVLTPVLRET